MELNRYKYRIVQDGEYFITQERILHFFWTTVHSSNRSIEDAKITVAFFTEADANTKANIAKYKEAKRNRRVVWP